MLTHIETTMSFTAGSPLVQITGGGNATTFIEGDLLYTLNRLPLPILSSTATEITLFDNATFSATDEEATLAATNGHLRGFFVDLTLLAEGYSSWFTQMDVWTSQLGKIMVIGPNGQTEVSTLPQILQDVSDQTAEVQTNLGLLASVPAFALEAKNWVVTAVDTDVPEGGVGTRSVLHYHTKTTEMYDQIQIWHGDINGWQQTVDSQHSDVGGWHSDVDGWQQTVGTQALNVSDNTTIVTDKTAEALASATLAQQYINHPIGVLIPGTTDYSVKHWLTQIVIATGGTTAGNSLQLGGVDADQFFSTNHYPEITEVVNLDGALTTLTDAINLNTAKVSNVSTDLSHTTSATEVVIVSSDGNNATLLGASEAQAGVMTAADKIAVNTIAALESRLVLVEMDINNKMWSFII